MTPFYLIPPSPLPQVEENQGQDGRRLLTPTTLTSSSSSWHFYFNSTEGGKYDHEDHYHQQQQKHETIAQVWTGETGEPAPLQTTDRHQCYNNNCIKPSPICKQEDRYRDHPCDNAPVNNRMAPNMRLMREMVNSERTATNKPISDTRTCLNDARSRSWNHEKRTNFGNGVIRVCADCNTTKTPLWRTGPRGPKSLCNACGIRQRKARRALANGLLVPTNDPSVKNKGLKEKQSQSHCTTPHKKLFKHAKNKLRLEDFTLSLSKNSAFHPQDERDAAILLMALSYGLVCT